MRHYLTIVKALACGKRPRILMALSHGEHCAGAPAELAGIRPAQASRHLWVLANAGPVDSEACGRCVCRHRAIARGGSLVQDTLHWVRAWLRGDPRMIQDATRLRTRAARIPVPTARRLRHGKHELR
jgi:DNA-binding transcriptional ArsR family regulator